MPTLCTILINFDCAQVSYETSGQKYENRPQINHPISILSKSEMKTRMKIMHNELCKIKKQRDRLIKKVEVLLDSNNLKLNPVDNEDMKNIILKEGEKILEKENLTLFQRLFWQQQAEAAGKSDPQAMRWHPFQIRWCIYLRYQSQSAYENIRQFISLPSQRTLRDYTHHIKTEPGFSSNVDTQLCNAARLGECEKWEKHVILLIDEMHIKEDLVSDKHTGEKEHNILHLT